jgi:hypothetical protein
VAGRLHELETALTAHGFAVDVEAKFWRIDVRSRPERLAPARTQRVQLGPDPAGTLKLSWWFVVPGDVDGITRLDPIGPETDIAGAVERIAQEMTRSPRGGDA